MLWRHRVCSVVLAAALAGAIPGAALAQSKDVTAALAEANKVLQKGGYAKAIEILDTALRSGKIPSDLAGRALLMRADANEKLGRTAFALADYNQALWMQNLSAADRKRAEDGKARLMKGLGVAEAPAPVAATESGARPAASANAPPSRPDWNTKVQEAPSEERTGGIGSIFGGLFASSSPSRPQPEEPQATPTASLVRPSPEADGPLPFRTPTARSTGATPGQSPAARPAAASGQATASRPVSAASGQSSGARPGSTASVQAPAVRPAGTAVAQATAPRPPERGNFSIQFAALLEEDKAIYEAERVGKRYAAELAGRTPTLMIVPTSDGGTLYKVVAGPYETRGESLATCELLKTKGVNCMVISRK